MRKPQYIDMRGLLSFYIMWLLKQRRMCGEELIAEIGRRRDDAPSPGTLYPSLNKLKKDGLIDAERVDKKKVYSLTPKGDADLKLAIDYFTKVYSEIINKSEVVETRQYSYAPKFKKSSEGDDLGIDYI